MRNVEIKANIRNLTALIAKAKGLSNSEGTLIPQFDTFYNSNTGRLKMRIFEEGNAELIYYNRPDSEGPKLSTYEKFNLDRNGARDLSSLLSKALGVSGIVKKKRLLFMVEQTRIHVDSVENLGDFIELEVALKDEETIEQGQIIANDLMQKLGVDKSDLLPCAYTDLLKQ